MTLKNTIIACAISAALAAAFTRFYFPAVKTETVNVDHDVVHNNIVTVTHTIKEASGVVDTTVTTTDNSTQVKTDTNTAIVTKSPTLNISGLVANDFSRGILQPVYGASVSKQVMGPVTAGVFGLSNGIIGLSIGLNF